MAKCSSYNQDSEQLAKATECLNNVFKYTDFKSDIQKKAVTNILRRRKNDVFISLPDGYGRALCYELPAAMFADTQSTLIICTWDFRLNVHVKKLQELGVPCEVLDKDLVNKDVYRIISDLHNGTIKPGLIYASPDVVCEENFEKLFTYLNKNKKLAFVVFDETHLEEHWFHTRCLHVGFYKKMGQFRMVNLELSWVVVLSRISLDGTPSLLNVLKLKTNDCEFAVFLAPVFRSNIFYDCKVVDSYNKMQCLKEFIDMCSKNSKSTSKFPLDNGSGLIYCKNQDRCKKVTMVLRESGVAIACLLSDLTGEEQDRILNDFISGVYKVLCVTSFSSRTFPRPLNIGFIAHWGLPVSLMSYFDNTLEAGKNGNFAHCRIYAKPETLNFYNIERELEFVKNAELGKDDNNIKLTVYLNTRIMKDYFVNIDCRHAAIADYFGDDTPKCIDKCDICIAINNLGRRGVSKKSSENPDKDKKDKKKIKALTKKMMML